MAQFLQPIWNALCNLTRDARLRAALADVEELRDECAILRFEKAIVENDRAFLQRHVDEIERAVPAFQAEIERLEAQCRDLAATIDAQRAAARPSLAKPKRKAIA